jgi:23S rRNA (cytosine1962-C5)-methyltransferase
MPQAEIILKPGKEESLLRFHPWIFSGAIRRIEGDPDEGELVRVRNDRGEFIAQGHCQVGSIAVRVLSFQDEAIDDAWWEERIRRARDLRRALGLVDNPETTCYRLIHGEGDGLPGLIVDIYGQTAVMQAHSVGMYRSREALSKSIRAVYGDQITALFDKSSGTLPFKAGIDTRDEYLFGRPSDEAVLENGNRFHISWEHGQKTGFFIDQRENRALVGRYARGRRVLNTFAYTGGFSVYALQGGAALVDSVDSSQRAIDLARQNVELNFGENAPHRAIAQDAFEFLRGTPKDAYDLIILDPPAFAKHHNVLGNALKGYQRLNARAIAQIAPGGILFTFSCSQAVSREHFRAAVFSAAASTGRNVRILHQLTQPTDHPINIYHPEGEYLKGLVVCVE